MVDNPNRRVGHNDPMRCQGVAKTGQCLNARTANSEFCPVCGGTKIEAKLEKDRAFKYKVEQVAERTRLEEFAGDNDIKSLRDEIGIMRYLLERLWNTLKTADKRSMYIDRIQQLIGQITKLVESTQTMEEKTDSFLERNVMYIIVKNSVAIVRQYVHDENTLKIIADKFNSSVESAASPIQGVQLQERTGQYRMAKYRLAEHGERVAEFANDECAKDLRSEIAFLRFTLEDLMNRLKDINQILLNIQKIQGLIGQIQRTVEASQRMEERTNNLLDRKVVVIIADSMVNIISQYMTNPDELTAVAEKLCASIGSSTSSKTYVRANA